MKLEKHKADELVKYWTEGSKEDLESAIGIFDQGKRIGPSLFYLHLALEKILKSHFVEKFQIHAPYTHNLIILAEKLEWEFTDDQFADLSEINQFNTIGRYPDIKDSVRKKFTTSYAKKYLKLGEELYQWISSR